MRNLSREVRVSARATKVCDSQRELTKLKVEQEEAEGEVNKLRQFQLQNEQGVILGLQVCMLGNCGPWILTYVQEGSLCTEGRAAAEEQWTDLQPGGKRALMEEL